ncbi:outer membrane protein assembly factor BamE [Acidovorax sp. ACV01]|uniref:outer membrane protein assembly factor BamE n=1 Tax=Acidovorax sp. ACV01 TaxID=2769311 RepID=UPI0017809CC0|nr:outer membrane protein assembly factor BamE [Acidovorax sp. ACV01]MBD9391845.1 outer membrane protein assembly factor BamE [Acidovorax sp. ACV01]
MPLIYRAAALAAAAFSLLALTACDPQRISELQPGVSTEADVRDRFGAPENVWDEADGARTLEYNRQPAGQVNYMITIGGDGRMTALRQVLTPENFARVVPGTRMDEVRRLLGKPAKVTPYELKRETHADWRYLEAPNQAKVFTVVYGPDQVVLRTQTGADLDAPEFKGGK